MKHQKIQEFDQAEILLNFLNLRDSSFLKIVEAKEPPDFILNDNTDLEVTQVIHQVLKETNTNNDKLIMLIREALFNEKMQNSYEINIYVSNRKIIFSKNKQLDVIQCVVDSIKGNSANCKNCGIENIESKIICPNYNSQRYQVEFLERNGNKKRGIVANGIREFFYIDKSQFLTNDIQGAISKKIIQYCNNNLSFQKLLVFIPHDADYLINSKELFEDSCRAISNTWKNIFNEVYCIVGMFDIDCGAYPLKFYEYIIYDFQKKKSYVFCNDNNKLTD